MLKLDTKVRIKKNSEYYYDGNKNNPKNLEGKIIQKDFDGSHNYRVEWLNGKTNYYREIDLEEIDPFILPEKWCIKLTLENIEVLREYTKRNGTSDIKGYIHSEGVSSSNTWTINITEGFSEITFDQFKKYVLKQDITTNKLEDKSLKLEEIQSKLIEAKYDKEDIKDIIECLNS